ncbi:MAG: hypothetical protein JXA57_07855, partial [Armatimonadetes bacterium]|nr:hypothetical protein [Armatimonadota bacterium]
MFEEEGPPLVLKLDNGSGFVAEKTRGFLTGHGVVVLYSPPYWPRFNGSCESSLGKLKVKTMHQAHRRGRPCRLMAEDLETARTLANDFRAKEPPALSRAQHYGERSAIIDGERSEFLHLVAGKRMEATAEKGYCRTYDLPRAILREVERVSVARALEVSGILEYRRRRISLPV